MLEFIYNGMRRALCWFLDWAGDMILDAFSILLELVPQEVFDNLDEGLIVTTLGGLVWLFALDILLKMYAAYYFWMSRRLVFRLILKFVPFVG